MEVMNGNVVVVGSMAARVLQNRRVDRDSHHRPAFGNKGRNDDGDHPDAQQKGPKLLNPRIVNKVL